ncbi:MAG TPA: EmrB/QacA family drug resistance transporter, partial [Terriglobia bacterium]|nr:EmrB/QacA family drug resistance transporter [Terriglobia bacterium]
IGGSAGIAAVTTVVARRRQTFTKTLGAHINPYNLGSTMMIERLRNGFIASGSDVATATRRAYAAVFGLVERQSAMLSFNSAFWLLAILFIAILPCILLMERPASGGPGAAAH